MYGIGMSLSFDPIVEARRNWERFEWGAEHAMAAATSITRAHQILLSRVDAALAPFGLTFSRFEALALLTFSSRGSMPLGKMGERLQVHPASVTNTIDRLEQAELVVRVPHPTDRRTTLAEITLAGRTAARDAAEAMADIEFGLAGMSQSANEELLSLLVDLRRNAGDF